MTNDEPFVRKLQRVSSHSYSVNVPKEIIDTFGWQEHQKVEIDYDEEQKEITIRDWEA